MRKYTSVCALASAAIALAFVGCSNDSSNPISTDASQSVLDVLDKRISSSSGDTIKSSSDEKLSSSSDEKPSSSSDEKTSSSSIEKDSSSVSSSSKGEAGSSTTVALSPIYVSHGEATPNTNRTKYVFQGSILINEPYKEKVHFTDVSAKLLRVDEEGVWVSTQLDSYLWYDPSEISRDVINYSMLGMKLENPNIAECGDYRLIVTASADGEGKSEYTVADTIDFVREDKYCSDTTLSEPELVKVEASIVIQRNEGFSFTKGKAVDESEADVVFTQNEKKGTWVVTGKNGFLVGEYSNDYDTNVDDDWSATLLPPLPVHLSDFRFLENRLHEEYADFNGEVFIVAVGPNYDPETGKDFYALTYKSEKEAARGTQLDIIYYKKK